MRTEYNKIVLKDIYDKCSKVYVYSQTEGYYTYVEYLNGQTMNLELKKEWFIFYINKMLGDKNKCFLVVIKDNGDKYVFENIYGKLKCQTKIKIYDKQVYNMLSDMLRKMNRLLP